MEIFKKTVKKKKSKRKQKSQKVKGESILRRDGVSHSDAFLMLKDPEGSSRSFSSRRVPTGTTTRRPRDGGANRKATPLWCRYLKRQQFDGNRVALDHQSATSGYRAQALNEPDALWMRTKCLSQVPVSNRGSDSCATPRSKLFKTSFTEYKARKGYWIRS